MPGGDRVSSCVPIPLRLFFVPSYGRGRRVPAAFVPQQVSRPAVVAGDQQIEVAVVVDVARGKPPAHHFRRNPAPACSFIPGSARRLARRSVRCAYLRRHAHWRSGHHVAVGDREVQPRVVVVVEEHRPESDIRARGLSQRRGGPESEKSPPEKVRKVCVSISWLVTINSAACCRCSRQTRCPSRLWPRRRWDGDAGAGSPSR